MMYKKAIDNLYATKEELVIVGLTGRTGAGCSTVAEILSRPFKKLDFEYQERNECAGSDKYKFEIIKEYISEKERWVPFEIIEVSSVILSFVFEDVNDGKHPIDRLLEYLTNLQKDNESIKFKIDRFEELKKEITGLKYIYDDVKGCSFNIEQVSKMTESEIDKYYDTFVVKMSKHKERIKKILQKYSCYEVEKAKLQDRQPIKYHLYTYLLQNLGNNIRLSGRPYDNQLCQAGFFSLAKRLEFLIEIIKRKRSKKVRICIDAIRNVNESNYLRSKYRGYYLLSISVDEKDRTFRMRNLNAIEKTSIDNVEYANKYKPEEFFYHQNIAQCFEMADIHIYNEQTTTPKKFFLTWQLVKYIALMIHPGLITPTQLERCMQVAFNVKYNSGCLSRQVGAVVTDQEFSIKSVGWNDVPRGQLPCNLRDVRKYCKGNCEEDFSKYEMEDLQFQEVMGEIHTELEKTGMIKRRYPYCFKDVYNGYTNQNNQVFTRALHAEENAFLQISRNGGQGVNQGFLFCTASPCELCSKKAYQLGITNIYFIDPYPGISEKHILQFGKNAKAPQMHLFYGAIGEAYMSLYRPLLPLKDELELVTGINSKNLAREIKKGGKVEPKTNDLYYECVVFQMHFKTRENIESTRRVEFTIQNGQFDGIDRRLTWTGSSYDGTEIIDGNYEIIEYGDKVSPYRYRINFGEMKNNQNPRDTPIRYTVRSKVKDESNIMHAYVSHYVKYPTKELILEIKVPSEENFMENVRFVRYADKEMKVEYPEGDVREPEVINEDKTVVYRLRVENPNLFYTYSLEWDFIKTRS